MRYCYLRVADDCLLWVLGVSLWYFGVALAVLPAVQVTRRLRGRRFRFSLRTLFLAMSGIAFLLGAWHATRTVGVRHVFQAFDQAVAAQWGSVRVDYDPIDEDAPTKNCHYLGNASSPFPLIVALDWSGIAKYPHSDTRYGGARGRSYYLWFFGLTWSLTHWDGITNYRV